MRDAASRSAVPKMTDRRVRVRGRVRDTGGKFATSGSPERSTCTVQKCTNPVQVKTRGWCEKHYTRWKRHGDPTFTHRPIRDVPAAERVRRRKAAADAAFREAIERIAPEGSSPVEIAAAQILASHKKDVVRMGNGCWAWTGSLRRGYGSIKVDYRSRPAHRWLWEQVSGPLDAAFHVDHTCHNDDTSCPGGMTCPHRRCVNPEHLEPVTPQVNTLRGRTFQARYAARTHCDNGHPFDEQNTGWRSNRRGNRYRSCKACRRERYAAVGKGTRPRITEDERALVRVLHAEGHTMREIGTQLGRSQRTVSDAIRRSAA